MVGTAVLSGHRRVSVATGIKPCLRALAARPKDYKSPMLRDRRMWDLGARPRV